MIRKQPTFALATTLILAVTTIASANHNLNSLRVGYTDECSQLRIERDALLKQNRIQHYEAARAFKGAERDARRLCEPERSCALAKIRADRKSEAIAFRRSMKSIKKSYNVAIREAKSRYELACRQFRPIVPVVEVATLPCGCEFNRCDCRPAPLPAPVCLEPGISSAHTSIWQQLTLMVPEVYRYETTRRVPTQQVYRRTAPAITYRVESEPSCTDERLRLDRRPVASLLRALLASH